VKYGIVRWSVGMAAAIALLSCQKEVVAPSVCPQACPGGSPTVLDTILTPIQDMDSTFVGYVQPGQGRALLVSEGLPSNQALTVVKFLPRADSLLFNDTLRTYTIDSIGFRVGLLARDSTIGGLEIPLYRIPSSTDSTVTYQDIEPFIDDSAKIGTITVPDSVQTDVFRLVVSDSATLDLLTLTPADSGVMAIAVAMTASQGTGIRIGSISAGGFGPLFQTFVLLDSVADTTANRQTITRIAQYNTFVYETPVVIDSSTLTIGGAPSARALLRFPLPPVLTSRDSSQIVRATLELIPLAPIPGLPNDLTFVTVRGVQSDLGAKSPRCSGSIGASCGTWAITSDIETTIEVGSSDTVSIEVGDLVRGWQGELGSEPALFIQLEPEAASFTLPSFGSSRSPGFVPRLLVTYSLPFPFGDR